MDKLGCNFQRAFAKEDTGIRLAALTDKEAAPANLLWHCPHFLKTTFPAQQHTDFLLNICKFCAQSKPIPGALRLPRPQCALQDLARRNMPRTETATRVTCAGLRRELVMAPWTRPGKSRDRPDNYLQVSLLCISGLLSCST